MKMKTVGEPWWQAYRKRQQKRLNMEMVIRKSICDAAKEYVTQSSIAGIKEIFQSDIGVHNRLIWIALFSTMLGTTCYYLFHTWSDTFTKPLVVSMESTTYPIRDIDFPAIAICNINRISKKALEKFARESYAKMTNHNYTFEEVLSFTRQMARLVDYSWSEELRKHPLLELIGTDPDEVTQQMKMLAPKCEESLVRCAWSGRQANCSEIFDVRRTFRGHCCAFNFILDYESAGRPNRMIADVKRQKSAGFLSGLNLILDTQFEDYSYPMSHMVGFDIFLFDPSHYADPSGGRVIHRILGANQTMMLELQSVMQTATEEVRKYPLSTRKCLFHDEKKEKFGNMYSFSACIVNCRIRTVQSLCKCTPFFMASGGGEPTCTLDQLSCLNKYKEKLLYLYPENTESFEGLETELQDSLYCPECLPDCEFTQHFTRACKIPSSMKTSSQHEFAKKQFVSRFKSGIDLINKCLISIYQATDYGTLDRLDVISYWFEIVSNIGGFAGVFLGFSFVATVEVFFFAVIRFPRILYENYKEFH